MNDEITKLIKFAKNVPPDYIKNLIYTDEGGSYVLFEQYTIKKIEDAFIVCRHRDDKMFPFYQLKNATVWVILDRNDLFAEANRVYELDRQLVGLKTEQIIHAKLRTKGTLDSYIVQTDKLQSVIDKQIRFRRELDKYIILAKTCQQRGFENELKRTARK